ncbi:MAG: hypothetical protein JST61_05500 [Acidobacteria bacterium]|nr:hypothetical protein [Acidobacteriota bacterium]
MRKLIALIAVALVVLLALNRQRVFIRNPLAKVKRNGVQVEGARVYINYSNDVLVEGPEGQPTYIVQTWNRVPGNPTALTCLRGIVCWTDADHARMVPLVGASDMPDTMMNDREVSFNDGYGINIDVALR